MPDLNWEIFQKLPGASTRNWEMLCRELIRRNYARFGNFVSLSMQPGVEFHLKLETDCSLGKPPRLWGWQCRWYDLPSGRSIGKTRRDKILDTIKTTEKHLPQLTDWVLWTRRQLTPSDQKWFNDINTPFTLHLWSAEEVEGQLCGEAEILRSTYFGELVLNSEILEKLHKQSVAPVKERWEPCLHVQVEVEEILQRALGESEYWNILKSWSGRISRRSQELYQDINYIQSTEQREYAQDLSTTLNNVAATLNDIPDLLLNGELYKVLAISNNPPKTISTGKELYDVARRLRNVSNPAALSVTASLAELDFAMKLFPKIRSRLMTQFIAVVGDAGSGKTFLAAEITASSSKRSAGILLLGRKLAKSSTLDDLINSLSMSVNRKVSFLDLIESVNAAGAREGRRLPIVIDGLNEAEDPRIWHDLLASLSVRIQEFPYIVLIVTLRSSWVKDALPPDLSRIEIYGFNNEIEYAINKYFDYYKIDIGDAAVPYERFSNPLFLRLFCEATNPERKKAAKIDEIPSSLTAVFERYRDVIVDRIRKRLQLWDGDIKKALNNIALNLWQKNARNLPFDMLREIVGDGPRDWDQSIARAFEEEGLLLRDKTEDQGQIYQYSALLFDAFAGFLISDAIIRQKGRQVLEWIRGEEVIEKLSYVSNSAHPLANDILHAFAGLLPRTQSTQLWPLLEGDLRDRALYETAELEGRYIDVETATKLIEYVQKKPSHSARGDLLNRLRNTRHGEYHPLNAEFLDRVLRPMSVAARDIRWTEWIRRNSDKIENDLRCIEQRWREKLSRSNEDGLIALWISWILTSTVHQIRDLATRALYWFGRGDAETLFKIAIQSLSINDPYVPERVLAAAYGVAMAHQLPDDQFAQFLKTYLTGLRDFLFLPSAKHPTNHWLTREYVSGVFEIAFKLHPSAIPDDIQQQKYNLQFMATPSLKPILLNDKRAKDCMSVLRMDFQNYVLGRLVIGRRNYDFKNRKYLNIIAKVRARIWDLGWRSAEFEELDNQIDSDQWRFPSRRYSVERYGKKYSWIAYFETLARMEEAEDIEASVYNSYRFSEIDIDPSFPEKPPRLPLSIPAWVRKTPIDNRRWVRSGIVEIPDELLNPDTLGDHPGPWVAVDGFLQHKNTTLHRRVFGFLNAILVSTNDKERLLSLLNAQPFLGNSFISSPPMDNHTYAGEFPWSDRFACQTPEEGRNLYIRHIESEYMPPIRFEMICHHYNWVNPREIHERVVGSVPSVLFSRRYNLYGVPQSFDQIDPSGRRASLYFDAPEGFEGQLLYLRSDLIKAYKKFRNGEIIWIIWGEREFDYRSAGVASPEWLTEIYQGYEMVWRHIKVMDNDDS